MQTGRNVVIKSKAFAVLLNTLRILVLLYGFYLLIVLKPYNRQEDTAGVVEAGKKVDWRYFQPLLNASDYSYKFKGRAPQSTPCCALSPTRHVPSLGFLELNCSALPELYLPGFTRRKFRGKFFTAVPQVRAQHQYLDANAMC